jgi:hypothetical protein
MLCKMQSKVLRFNKGYEKLDFLDGLIKCHILLAQIFDSEGNVHERQAASQRCKSLIQIQSRRRNQRDPSRSWTNKLM